MARQKGSPAHGPVPRDRDHAGGALPGADAADGGVAASVPPAAKGPDADPTEADLPDVDLHSAAFRQARASLRTALMEDYIELIDDLIRDGQEARQVDIAARLGVAQPTVAKMLGRLAQDGLVTRKAYRGVFLTAEGARVAHDCRARHRTVETFLRALGVSPETARIDAEGIEHHVSGETLDAFARLIAERGAD